MQERLIRCEIGTDTGKKFYRYAGTTGDAPMDQFPSDGRLRLAQQLLSGSEHILGITERFVGKLQDVIISFGDPDCNTTISDITVPATSTPKVCPTTSQSSAASTRQVIKDDTCLDVDSNPRKNGAKWNEGKWVKCECNVSLILVMPFT
ncbi:Hypothetical predicted protein [Paramuricea clavata]|uniref:Uncharacterized protein n=1 Tax=Paramuricea clavata TaxID=317549 RepID=A0A7D9JAH7_PARCT|nr:Hypothetical predicted protein [Paramuricea clavata]